MTAFCPSDNELSRFIDGVADAEERAAVQAHLERCADCREVVAIVVQTRRDVPPLKRPRTE